MFKRGKITAAVAAAVLVATSVGIEASATIENPRIAYMDGNVEQRFVDEVNRQLGFLPDEMLYEFELSGWRIFVTDKNVDAYFCGGRWGSVQGVLVQDEALIAIEDRDVAVTEAPIHEMGHWYDHNHGYPSQTAEFGQIYATETSAFLSAFDYYSYYAQEELFAEATWKYYCDAETLEDACPRLYAYMDAVLGSAYPEDDVSRTERRIREIRRDEEIRIETMKSASEARRG